MSDRVKTIALLDGSNYETWSVSVKNLLREKTLWVYVNGTIPRPTSSNQPIRASSSSSKDSESSPSAPVTSASTVATPTKEAQQWEIQDDSAAGLILGLVTTTIAQEVENQNRNTSQAIWTYLEKTYKQTKNHGWKYATLLRMRRSRFTGSSVEELREHLNSMIVLNRSLDNMTIGDSVFAFDMIYSLPDEAPFASIKDGIIAQYPNLEDLTPTIVRDHFVDRIVLNPRSLPSEVQTTLAATLSRPTCEFCKKIGHTADKCYKKNPQLDPRRRKVSSSTPLAVMPAVSVPSTGTEFAGQTAFVTSAPTPSASVNAQAYFNGRKVWVAVSLDAPRVCREAIYVDSGCSEHVSPMREYFDDSSFTMLHTPVEITVGDSRTLHATHFGDIALVTTLPDGTANHFLLKNVLYCEQMVATLLSTSSLNKRGIGVNLNGNDSCIYHAQTKEIIALCPVAACNLPQLSATPVPSKTNGTSGM